MASPELSRPIPWPEAFSRQDPAALQSQAALLLLVGSQVRGDVQALQGKAAARRRHRFTEAVPASDARIFDVPRLSFGDRLPGIEEIGARLTRRYGRGLHAPATKAGAAVVAQPVLADLAGRFRRNPTPPSAVALMHASLQHGDQLPRVAAAYAMFPLSPEPARLLAILADGTRSRRRLTREVAATALARVAPEHPRLRALVGGPEPRAGRSPAHTSLLVHGTFAQSGAWWQPGGDFHSYLLANVRSDLYQGADRFQWSGGYSDGARSLGASQLVAWVADHGAAGLDLFTHSHGGSVAMQATQTGLTSRELVLLSCPVHVDQYLPDFSRVSRVVSIHVHLDLVILVDGGGQRFRHPRIEENVLPVWFDHFATHDPATWEQYDVKSKV